MNNLQKYLARCLLATATLFGGAFPAFAADAPLLGAASEFAVLGGTAVTCTTSVIAGDVGSGGAFTNTGCTIAGAVIAPVSAQVLIDFNSAYAQYADIPCTGLLETAYTGATLTLTPGVYCNVAAVTFTNSTLTLDGQGDANAVWIFKIGTGGTGALTGTNFSVVMADGGQPCNVYWWVAEAATMTDSRFIGTILAGAAITMTDGTNTLAGRALAKAAVTMTNATVIGCDAISDLPYCKSKKPKKPHGHDKDKCNQGVGNGPEGCDPGDSNHHSGSNDEDGGTPGNPGRKGSNR
jgi:hypothetical protein